MRAPRVFSAAGLPERHWRSRPGRWRSEKLGDYRVLSVEAPRMPRGSLIPASADARWRSVVCSRARLAGIPPVRSGLVDGDAVWVERGANSFIDRWLKRRITALLRRRAYRVALDQRKIGKVVTEQMEALEVDYGEGCEIGDVCSVVEIIGPHGSTVRVRSSDPRSHIAIGLLRVAEATMLGAYDPEDGGEA